MSEKDIIEKDIIFAYNTAMQKIRKLKEYAIIAADKNNKQLEDVLNEQKERLKQTKQEIADKDAQIDELIVRATALARRVEEKEKVIEGYKGLTKNILDIILECAKDTLNEGNYREVAGMDNIKDMVFYMMHEMKQTVDLNKKLRKETEELKNEKVRESKESEMSLPYCFGSYTREYGPCKKRCMFGDRCEQKEKEELKKEEHKKIYKENGECVEAKVEYIPCFGNYKHRLLCEELCEFKDKCKRATGEARERRPKVPDCIGEDVFKEECRTCPYILRCLSLQAQAHALFHHDW